MAAKGGKQFIGALDQGTTSSRFIVFNKQGRIVSTAQKEHAQIFPASACVEHDPEEIWARTEEVITEALRSAGITAADLAAVGITNQRETVVVWNRLTGKAYHNAIVWQDQRGAPLCEATAARLGGPNALASRTGLPIVPYFSASKLRWILDNAPDARADAEAGVAIAGTIDTYLAWRLTGGGGAGGAGKASASASEPLHITDVSNASRTLLCNIHTLSWDPYLCEVWGVPARMLPRILPSSAVYGTCASTSVLPGVTLSGILGDQQAALFGQACFKPGDAKNTYGTGCFLLMNTGETPVPSHHGLITTVAYQLGAGSGAPSKPVYALEGSVAVAGAVVTWLRDSLGAIANSKDSEALARSVPDSGGVVFVPAFNGLFAPHWRSDARGVIAGLSGNTTKAHITRAALESIAHQSRELLLAMEIDAQEAGLTPGGGSIGTSSSASTSTAGGSGAGAVPATGGTSGPDLRVDGGATANGMLMQFQSDVLGRRVVRPVVAETTALGAAYAAGLAVGFWSSLDELRSQWAVDAVWSPSLPKDKVDASIRDWDRAVKRTLGWAEPDLDVHHGPSLLAQKAAQIRALVLKPEAGVRSGLKAVVLTLGLAAAAGAVAYGVSKAAGLGKARR